MDYCSKCPNETECYREGCQICCQQEREIERLRASYELAEEAALFLLRTGSWVRLIDRERALAMLDRARASPSKTSGEPE